MEDKRVKELEEMKLYVKRSLLENGVEYQISNKSKEGFEESDLEKLTNELNKEEAKKWGPGNGFWMGLFLGRLEKYGICTLTYDYRDGNG